MISEISMSVYVSVNVFFFWQVTVPKGSLCNLNVEVDVGLPPDAVYNIVIDPDNRRVFKNIKVGDFIHL